MVTWKVLAEYSWKLTTTQLGSFLCTAASSMPIRAVTREVRYIHELSLILEHFMPISSPGAPGLTPTPQYIGTPNGPLAPRLISAPKPCLIRIQSSLGFQPFKCVPHRFMHA